jgi:hypothetical protein
MFGAQNKLKLVVWAYAWGASDEMGCDKKGVTIHAVEDIGLRSDEILFC